jgi:hypothetical protein
MEKYFSRLTDINERLREATNHLRKQQSLVPGIDCPRSHHALLLLLSHGLRVYCGLQAQRRAIHEKIAEYFPLRHS